MSNYRYAFGWNGKLYKFQNSNRELLLNELVLFMAKNNINYSSDDLSKGIDRQSALTTAKPSGTIGMADAVNGAFAVMRYASNQAASSQEIARRAEICRTCPQITRLKQCSSCGTAGKIANFVSSIRTKLKLQEPIPDSVKSSYCSVCKCSLALMVVSKMEAFSEPAQQNNSRPDVCWLKKTSTNYLP